VRLLQLTENFHRAMRRLAPAGSQSAQSLAATLGRIQGGVLPGPLDAEMLIPPVLRAWWRRVPGCNLWVMFTFDESAVRILGLLKTPPVPVDE
jgi:hypothetical protein